MMTENALTERLHALEEEMARGRARLARLDAERDGLVRQLLRLEGAIALAAELTASPATVGLARTG